MEFFGIRDYVDNVSRKWQAELRFLQEMYNDCTNNHFGNHTDDDDDIPLKWKAERRFLQEMYDEA